MSFPALTETSHHSHSNANPKQFATFPENSVKSSDLGRLHRVWNVENM